MDGDDRTDESPDDGSEGPARDDPSTEDPADDAVDGATNDAVDGPADDASADSSTEADLMAATGRALARHGVADVTTQKIADEWGRSQSLLHYYHDTKADLIVAYIDHLRERWSREYGAEVDESPLDRLRWLFDREFDEGSEGGDGGESGESDESDEDCDANGNGERSVSTVLFELHAQAPHDERYRAALDGLEADAREFVEASIREGIEAGAFRDVDVEAVATLLLSAHDGGILRAAALGRSDDWNHLRDGVEDYLDAVLLADGS